MSELHFNTGLAIAQDVHERAGIDDDITTKTKRFVNRAYYDLLKVADWPWARNSTPNVIDVVDRVDDTIVITKGTTTGTITTSAADDDLKGYKLLNINNKVEYRIANHVLTAATLDATWKEDTISTAEDVYIYKDEYSLADNCLMPRSFYNRNTSKPIEFDSTGKYRKREYARESSEILLISLITNTKVIVSPFVKDGLTIEYVYTKTQAALDITGEAGDVPVVPAQDRHVIADIAYRLVLKDWRQKGEVIGKIRDVELDIRDKIRAMKNMYINVGSSVGGLSG